MSAKLTFRQSLFAGLTAGIASVITNAILFFIFHAAGVLSDDILIKPNQPLTVAPIIFGSLMPSLVAGIVFFLFERFTSNGFRIFAIVAIVLNLLSLYGPFSAIPGVTTGYALVLCTMHVVVLVWLLYFIKKAKQQNSKSMSTLTV